MGTAELFVHHSSDCRGNSALSLGLSSSFWEPERDSPIALPSREMESVTQVKALSRFGFWRAKKICLVGQGIGRASRLMSTSTGQ